MSVNGRRAHHYFSVLCNEKIIAANFIIFGKISNKILNKIFGVLGTEWAWVSQVRAIEQAWRLFFGQVVLSAILFAIKHPLTALEAELVPFSTSSDSLLRSVDGLSALAALRAFRGYERHGGELAG
jgi:hypothetical protein